MAGRKVQVPVVGGLRKVITVQGPTQAAGTTIAGFANQTVSLAQLASALGVTPTKPTPGGSSGGGAAAALVPGPGLVGGGVLVGAVPLHLLAPIPAFVFDSDGGGGDGDPGPPGTIGINGANGAVGPPGPSGGPPGPPGPATFLMEPEQGEDGWPIPGPRGVSGAAGPAGPVASPVIWMPDDGHDGDMGPPGVNGAAGTGGGGSSPTSTILLHFNGTNGQTTTVDSGPGAFPVTFAGDAALSSTQTKFGATSLGVGTSGGGGVSIPLADFNLSDPGYIYTIDFWIYRTSTTDALLIGQWGIGSGFLSWGMFFSASQVAHFWSTGGSSGNFPTGPAWPSAGAWHHFAFQRNGPYLTIFLDGVFKANIVVSTDIYFSPTLDLTIGYQPTSAPHGGITSPSLVGWIDELRITKGQVLYTQNFTPPTVPYTS